MEPEEFDFAGPTEDYDSGSNPDDDRIRENNREQRAVVASVFGIEQLAATLQNVGIEGPEDSGTSDSDGEEVIQIVWDQAQEEEEDPDEENARALLLQRVENERMEHQYQLMEDNGMFLLPYSQLQY